MNIKSNIIIFIALALTFVSCGGSDATPKDPMDIYGIKFNPEREKIGLKPLPDDFAVGERVPGWIRTNFDSLHTTPKAYYTQKVIYLRGDTLVKEMDEFRLLIFPSPEYGKTLAILKYIYIYDLQERFDFDSTDWGYTYWINEFPNELDGIPRHDEDSTGTLYIDRMIRGDKKDDPRIPFTREEADSILASWGLTYP